MPEAIIITPVKDSLETTKLTIEAISKAEGNFEYLIFNDFSSDDTKTYLNLITKKYGFSVIHLEDITNKPSPNYKLVLEMAQKKALEKKCPLVVVESDVVVKPNTFMGLLNVLASKEKAGIIGAITVDRNNNYNFPYTFEKTKSKEIVNTNHSLSFCCTLLSQSFLQECDFSTLSQKKDWYDVYISRQSKRLGYLNYLAKNLEVLHLPHSSRPWKNLKYTNPLLYYFKKIVSKRDRI